MVFMQKTLEEIELKGFKVVDKDFQRPWGGFLVIDESQAQDFSNSFFNGIDVSELKIAGKLSPKILMVKSKSRLSWQYHYRREEIWSVQKGPVGVVVSNTDFEKEMIQLRQGDQIKLKKEQRHRLIGLDDWAVIAEIWQHTEKDNPSNEDDIVRINDDYGR